MSATAPQTIASLLLHLRSPRLRGVLKELIWIAGGQATAIVGSIVGVRILTELLRPDQYGELALGVTIATLVNQVIHGSLMNGAMRFYAPAVERGALRAYLAAMRELVLLSTGVILLAALFGSVIVSMTPFSPWLDLSLAAVIYSLFAGCDAILSGIQNAARQRIVVAFHQGLAACARFLLAAGMILLLGERSASAMVGYALAMLFVLASQYLFFKRLVRSKTSGELGKVESTADWRAEIVKYSWPFATWGVFVWAQQASDRWALQMFCSAHEVGLFAVLFQLGFYPLSLLASLFFQLAAPIFFQRIGDASDETRVAATRLLNRRLVAATLAVAVVVSGAALFVHRWVFRVLAAPAYGEVSYLLPWVLLSGGLFAAGQVLAINHMSARRSDRLIAPRIISAILGICLNLIGAYYSGVRGIVAASLLFSLVYFSWMASTMSESVATRDAEA